MNNSDPVLELGMEVSSTATTSTTTMIDSNDDGKQQRVDVEKSGASSSSSNSSKLGEGRPQLIELPYPLRVRKLKIAIIVLMVSLDGFLLPTFLFYILKYGAHISDKRSQFFSLSIYPSSALQNCKSKMAQKKLTLDYIYIYRCINHNRRLWFPFLNPIRSPALPPPQTQLHLPPPPQPPPVVP